MADLVTGHPDAMAWVIQSELSHSSDGIFGKIAHAVIWSNATGPDGELLVPIDPDEYVARVNTHGIRLLHNHDPGAPLGKVLSAAKFTRPDGMAFIVAMVAHYEGGSILNFSDVGFDPEAAVASPARLPLLPDTAWVNFGADPRDVDKKWIDDILTSAPMRAILRFHLCFGETM